MYPALQRNAAQVKVARIVPKPIISTVKINGQPAQALLDSGSLGDFISSTLADQLQLPKIKLENPLLVQLAVQGSRSRINYRVAACLQYESITENRTFDVINISQYDLILGTPWLYQHNISMSMNPTQITIGSTVVQPIEGEATAAVAV